jgi:MFS family permease
MPCILTLGTELSGKGQYGSTLGMLDAMDNVGKAMGPIVAGLLLGLFSYPISFAIIAGILVAVAILFCTIVRDIG